MKKTSWIIFLIIVIIVAAAYFSFQSQQAKNYPNFKAFPTQVYPQEKSSSSSTSSGSDLITAHEIPLQVTFPINGSTVSTSPVLVKGKTLPNAEVFVNENELRADGQGNFSSAVDLDEGENTIFVVANDDKGNYAEEDLTVNFVVR